MSESETIDDGGPAFPVVDFTGSIFCGMSLLAWLTGQALANSAIAHSNLDEDATAMVCISQAQSVLRKLERINANRS